MTYKSNAYRSFISSSRWQRLRAYHLKHHPLCVRCEAKGKTTLAREVHHIRPCGDDPVLQADPLNLEAYAGSATPQCRNDRRGYSREITIDGYFVDERHPSNRTRQTKLQHRTPGGGKNKNDQACEDRWDAFAERLC